ncbi:MAG: transglycosylase SLT domain-containing protein [Gammaproteobacteria bacterium]|nr:transglycosylase SLT domain-containing protein [Gammaproteobacteria bacterium]
MLRVKCARLLAASLASLLIATANANENAADPELRALLAEAINNTDSFPDRFEAEVWLKDMSNRLSPIVPDNQERIDILTRVHQEATRVDLPPELILAVIDIESRFDRYAISRAGARGLMQVMPFWLEELNRPNDNLFQIEINLRMGCTILKHYIDKEDGNMTQALARYNGSYGKTWYSEKVLGRLSTQWFRN